MRWLVALAVCLWSSIAVAQEAGPTLEAIVTEVEEGLALLNAGETEAAFARLNAVNELAQDHQPDALATFYPNAALALYFYDIGQPKPALQFATAAVAGLTSHGLSDHRARYLASVVQGAAQFQLGRPEQAEAPLRAVVMELRWNAAQADLYGMALGTLARVLSRLGSRDAPAMRRAFLDGLSPDWRVRAADVLQLRYLQLQYEEDRGADPAALLPQAAGLSADAEQTPGIPPMQRIYYLGYHGHLLMRTGDYEAAEEKLRAQYDHYRTANARHGDVWENLRRLAEVTLYTKDAQTGYDLLGSDMERAKSLNAPIDEVALIHRDLGRIANGAGNRPLAQAHFREAYATARSHFAATSEIAVHLRRFIDTQDAGLSEYQFRGELAAPGFDVMLRADAAHVLYLFLQGQYLPLGDWFARTEPGQNPAFFYINRALYRALIGQPNGMLADLQAAQQAAHDGSELHPQAPIFDVIHTVGFAWGSEHDPARASRSVAALEARRDALGPVSQMLVTVLSAYVASQRAEKEAFLAALATWVRHPVVDRPKGPWEIFANSLALEMGYGNLPPDRLANIRRASLSAMGENYALLRSLDSLAFEVLARSDGFSDAALAERVGIERALSAQLPPWHPVLASARFAMATAHQNRGETQAAHDWLDKAIATLRAAPTPPRDRLAYQLARQGRVLLVMGQENEALARTTDALGMVSVTKESGTYLGEVLIAHAEALLKRTGNAARLEAFLADWMARPGVLASLLPEARADLWILRGIAVARIRDKDAEPVFQAAREAMSAPHWDWRSKLSRLDQLLAEYRYQSGDMLGAWEAVTRATDTYADWVRDGAGAVRAQKDILRRRAVWEAGIGWALARDLGEE